MCTTVHLISVHGATDVHHCALDISAWLADSVQSGALRSSTVIKLKLRHQTQISKLERMLNASYKRTHSAEFFQQMTPEFCNKKRAEVNLSALQGWQ